MWKSTVVSNLIYKYVDSLCHWTIRVRFEELLRKFLQLIYPFATSSWVNNEANFSLANLSSPYDNLFSIVTENELLSETLASQAQRTTNYLFKVNSETM